MMDASTADNNNNDGAQQDPPLPPPSHMVYESTAEETALSATVDQELRVPFYCEENVWRLAYRQRHFSSLHGSVSNSWVVFISNAIKSVPMFYQRASPDPNRSVCWDYHVILVVSNPAAQAPQHAFLVYDLDSRLPYPCPLTEYLQFSFPCDTWPAPLHPFFRVVEANLFLQYFSSDRRHMYQASTGKWNAPPPRYAPIQDQMTQQEDNSLTRSNLDQYLNFVAHRPVQEEPGSVLQVYGTISSLKRLRQEPHESFVVP